jgi:hypothetical protein
MRSLTDKKAKAAAPRITAERAKVRKGSGRIAQCCAKTSKNVAGCHD